MYLESLKFQEDIDVFLKKTKPEFKVYTRNNYKNLPQINKNLSEEELYNIDIVSLVLPFKVNSYVVQELIDWNNIPKDPIFIITFPQKEMLIPEHFNIVAKLIKENASKEELDLAIYNIRMQLNPHPAEQITLNIPTIDGEKLMGLQHKYRETALFFPTQGQTCHSYCTFCFRWPQFINLDNQKFASKEVDLLIKYLNEHKEITDILFTGGDPMVMNANILSKYLNAIIDKVPTIKNIRIGSKSLSYWPYRFISDNDSEDILKLFEKVIQSGRHLAFMAHFNHYNELKTPAVKFAIKKLRSIGVEIRTQSPLLKHINDTPEVWAKMWEEQVRLGCIPYYFFIARETGAQHYFCIGLEKAWEIFQKAYNQVSGLSRTVRGPSMSAYPGKIQIIGITEIKNEKVYVLQFLQARNPDWVARPFFAKYDPEATWLTQLKPAFGEEQFFWEDDFSQNYL